MKNIKDYLHLYLGCRFKVDGQSGKFELAGWNPYTSIQNVSGQVVFHDLSKIKLILRPLSDMTEEEALQIAKLVSEPQYIESRITNISFKPTIKEGLNIQCIDWEAFQVIKHIDDKPIRLLLHICNWGTITLYVNGDFASNNKAMLVTHLLLSKGFDLFGLIEDGLAIESSLMV